MNKPHFEPQNFATSRRQTVERWLGRRNELGSLYLSKSDR
jgi:hypothetical protein